MYMAFFSSAITTLKTLVVAIGAGLGVWGVVNLLEGYGNDNPGAKSQGIKQLMTEDEIAVMDGGKCILQIRGARPFFSDKYDITKHKNYRFLADENEKNRYKVEKELNPQYTPKPEEEVEVIHVELSE